MTAGVRLRSRPVRACRNALEDFYVRYALMVCLDDTSPARADPRRSARQHPGCLQRGRRADHVAELRSRSRRDEDRAEGALVDSVAPSRAYSDDLAIRFLHSTFFGRRVESELAPGLVEAARLVGRQFRRLVAELGDGLGDDPGHERARHPLVSAGTTHHGAHLRAGVSQHLLERVLIRVPVLAFFEVAERELPVLGGILEPFREAIALLVLRDVEEELQDQRAVADQMPLEAVDVVVAVFPEALAYLSAPGSRCASSSSGCTRTTSTSS